MDFIVVMGVSGSGKTTVGKLLAQRLGWDFYDADSFHSPENIAKMAHGIPLTDADRAPWLAALRSLIQRCIAEKRPGVLACSALKDSYRDELTGGAADVRIVYLKGSYELIWSRIAARKGHYMKPDMLKSQFDTLQEPTDALVVDIDHTPEEIVDDILSRMQL